MKFYIVDDDKNIIRILSNIIEKNNNFEVVGSALNGEAAFQEIMVMKPDIVLVDLLMPVMDGNTLVKKLKEVNPHLSCIMISQVLDNQIRTESYNSGIEFFITKPINKIEVEKVITRVAEKEDFESRIKAGASIFNVSGGANTPGIVRQIRERHPYFPIIATGGPTPESILETIKAGANTITYTPPAIGDIFSEMMEVYRHRVVIDIENKNE
jgi:DNA-binding NarL/FixJ family response regulator